MEKSNLPVPKSCKNSIRNNKFQYQLAILEIFMTVTFSYADLVLIVSHWITLLYPWLVSILSDKIKQTYKPHVWPYVCLDYTYLKCIYESRNLEEEWMREIVWMDYSARYLEVAI